MVTTRAATEKMILTASSEAAKADCRTTTRIHLAKIFYTCLLDDVGASRQTSRVRQGQEQVCQDAFPSKKSMT